MSWVLYKEHNRLVSLGSASFSGGKIIAITIKAIRPEITFIGSDLILNLFVAEGWIMLPPDSNVKSIDEMHTLTTLRLVPGAKERNFSLLGDLDMYSNTNARISGLQYALSDKPPEAEHILEIRSYKVNAPTDMKTLKTSMVRRAYQHLTENDKIGSSSISEMLFDEFLSHIPIPKNIVKEVYVL